MSRFGIDNMPQVLVLDSENEQYWWDAGVQTQEHVNSYLTDIRDGKIQVCVCLNVE